MGSTPGLPQPVNCALVESSDGQGFPIVVAQRPQGEADPSGYEAGLHWTPFARELDAAYRDRLFGAFLYSNRLFLAAHLYPPNVAVQSVVRFLADAGTDRRAGINERNN